MSMPNVSFDDDHPLVDPDQLKMPEADGHRRAVDLIGLAAIRLLGPQFRVFRDMNWYPAGGGNPVAPDLMVLPADAIDPRPTSYRQDQTGGPSPLVVVEVPSESDSFVSFREKAFRYQSLGTTVYLVVVEGARTVLRLGVGDAEPLLWTNHPIPELGDLRLTFDHGELMATLPDGLQATSDGALVAQLDALADDARKQADDARQQAGEAEERAEALRRQLVALGVAPEV